jgi:hypothetical protein
MTIELKYAFHAHNTYFQGKPVIVEFTLENNGDADLWILKWYTPLEGIKGKILQVTCDREEIPYEGIMMKRGNPSRDDYVLLHPHASARAEFDLAEVYSLKPCDECQLSFKGRIHDVVFDPSQLPPADHEQNPVDAEGDPASFQIKNN